MSYTESKEEPWTCRRRQKDGVHALHRKHLGERAQSTDCRQAVLVQGVTGVGSHGAQLDFVKLNTIDEVEALRTP